MSVVATLAAADREADERGWVSSRRSFPSKAMTDVGLPRSPLFVIADDVVEPGQGFGRHGHRDMEILSYVVEGALEHADSTQGASVLHPGEIQRMTAGAGIEHSEYNASASEPVRFLQIWIKSDATGLAPGYAHAAFDPTRSLTRLAGPSDAAVAINQAMVMWRAAPTPGERIDVPLADGETAWVHGVRGTATVADRQLAAGDGLAVAGEPTVAITGGDDPAEVLVFVAQQPATSQ